MSRVCHAALAGMRHYGYTDEQIAFAEQPVLHTDECEFIEQVGWQCESEEGKPLHPGSVELNAEFEMAQVHIDAADAYDATHGIHRVKVEGGLRVGASMAEVLAEHQCFETYYTNNRPYLCNCGERVQNIHAHQEAMLETNGYGKL